MNNEFNDYILDRLLTRRRINPVTKCWVWTGSRHPTWRYGNIHYRKHKRTYKVHRLIAYLCLGLDLDSDVQALHKCDNPPCFNPLHIFLGDNWDNQKDASSKGRLDRDKITHCMYGHELTEENIYYRYPKNRYGIEKITRECRICMKRRELERSK